MIDLALPHAVQTAPPPLHAPDGFMSLPVALVAYAISALVIAYAVKRTDKQLNERMVPLMGVMAAFVFAVQMLNFPVAGGTSGHFIGGAFASILLGPWAAVLVMAAVVSVQALVFQDGGLVVLGANILNIGVLSCLVGYGVYRSTEFLGSGMRGLLVRGFAASWISVVLSAAAVGIELAISGTTALSLALPVMIGVHAFIGVGEGLITVGALSFIRTVHSDLLKEAAT